MWDNLGMQRLSWRCLHIRASRYMPDNGQGRSENKLMKVYGAQICIDCRNYKGIQKSRGFDAEYIEITEDTGKLKEFLQMRDHDPVLASVREQGGIGIPLFVHEDGRKTLDMNEAFSWIGQPPVRDDEILEKR